MFKLTQSFQLDSPLKKGDTVALLAPGSLKNTKSVRPAQDYLSSLGLKNKPCTIREHSLYSAPDSERLNDLLNAIEDESVKAIWALYGGYGTTRLLPALSERSSHKNKLLIGFSDVTALLAYFSQKWGWKPMHGPMLAQIVEHRIDETSKASIEDLLFGRWTQTMLPNLIPLNAYAEKTKKVEGPLGGGNLSVLQYSLGTFWQPSYDKSILFFEDVDERAYRISNFLEHFTQAEIFKSVNAVVFGQFSFQKEQTGEGILINQALLEFAQKQNFPVFKGEVIGHGIKNYPLQIGVKAQITR